MKKARKIIVVDARSSLLQLCDRLHAIGFEVETLRSNQCDARLAVNRPDIQDLVLALSGSDSGLEIAQTLNRQLGLCDTQHINTLYDKVAQHAFIKKHLPELALPDAQYFDNEAALKNHLAANPSPHFIRPNLSSINGSAILYDGDYPAIQAEIKHLFSYAKKIITHPFIEGCSYFINGMIVEGKLHLTDCWQCFNVPANRRFILTSVISTALKDELIQKTYPQLQCLCEKYGLRFSPIHFEVLMTKTGPKIIKMVPRLTTEPLPTLCRLAGIQNHAETLFSMLSNGSLKTIAPLAELKAHVADYSLIVKQAGLLQNRQNLERMKALPSFYQTYDIPALGAFLPQTVCGSTYGATFLYKHSNQNQILEDIAFGQALNLNEGLLPSSLKRDVQEPF